MNDDSLPSAIPLARRPSRAHRRERDIRRGIRWGIPLVVATCFVGVALLFGGLVTDAWPGEPKNTVRWVAVVLFAVFGSWMLWLRFHVIRTLRRQGEWPTR